jgi:iron-sulfur cluster repair protein YtfE (RIC family)
LKEAESLKSLIRLHPQSVKVFQDIFGYDFWNHLDAKLSDLCKEFKKDESAIREKLDAMAVSPIGQNWSDQPLYDLVESLTREHFQFRTRDLPNIHRLLDECRLEYGLEKPALKDLDHSFHDFRLGFINHMEEEEDFLFFKILRTEASVKYPQLYPEVFKGSVSMYPPSLLLSSEAEVADMISTILSKAESIPDETHPGWEEEPLLKALRSFDAKIKAHADLEVQILIPRAKAMEAELKKRA